jgi:hypothetical protein
MAVEIAKQLRPITEETAIEDYQALCDTPCDDINPRGLTGSKAVDYFFFRYRIMTKSGKGINFIDWLKTKQYNKPYIQHTIKYSMERGTPRLKALYAAFSLYSGAISSFKPIIARKVYCAYNPTTVLDFSAGWGGRCLAAMSLDINYIGFDTNTALKPAYKGLVELYPTKSKVTINFKDSSKVDYSKYRYDMVFTSPPYYKQTRPTEGYQNMPEYTDREDFNSRFFYPVVQNTYKYLSRGGTYILNIPLDMYEDIKPILGKADKLIPLTLSSGGKTDYTLKGQYKEYIYVWKKN